MWLTDLMSCIQDLINNNPNLVELWGDVNVKKKLGLIKTISVQEADFDKAEQKKIVLQKCTEEKKKRESKQKDALEQHKINRALSKEKAQSQVGMNRLQNELASVASTRRVSSKPYEQLQQPQSGPPRPKEPPSSQDSSPPMSPSPVLEPAKSVDSPKTPLLHDPALETKKTCCCTIL